MQRGRLPLVSRKEGLRCGSFVDPRRICAELVSKGRQLLARLSVTRVRPMPALPRPSSWRKLIPGRPGLALARLRSRNFATISSNGTDKGQHARRPTRPT